MDAEVFGADVGEAAGLAAGLTGVFGVGFTADFVAGLGAGLGAGLAVGLEFASAFEGALGLAAGFLVDGFAAVEAAFALGFKGFEGFEGAPLAPVGWAFPCGFEGMVVLAALFGAGLDDLEAGATGVDFEEGTEDVQLKVA